MAVLVDGNNLLYAAYDADPERPPGRERLCALLGQWSKRSGERVSVVFDGVEPAPELAEQLRAGGVETLFSGHGVKADAVVIELIADDSAPKRLIVVSTDREIARAARRRRATPMRSDEFWTMMTADLARPPHIPLEPLEKRRGLSPGQAAEWMKELGLEEREG